MAKKSGLTCEIRNAKTGKRIAWTWGITGATRWEWISRVIASEHECNPDDVGCIDNDDRFDNVTVGGKIVAYWESNLLEQTS
jgi:hypothetical protein